MKVAVTYENGNIFQHFGHTKQIKIYNVDNKKIVDEIIIDTLESGHGAIVDLLSDNGVDVLICGGIGGGARIALDDANIKLYGGVSGSAEAALKALIDGNLEYNENVICSHHENENHSCGEHKCGEDKHGCSGNH